MLSGVLSVFGLWEEIWWVAEDSMPSGRSLRVFWILGARSGVGSSVGVGTNLRPRLRTSSSSGERSMLESFTTAFREVDLLVGVVWGRGPWKVWIGNEISSTLSYGEEKGALY